MRIIDKVLEEHEGLSAEDVVGYECPHYYGFKLLEFDECRKTSCEECWNREIEEVQNE